MSRFIGALQLLCLVGVLAFGIPAESGRQLFIFNGLDLGALVCALSLLWLAWFAHRLEQTGQHQPDRPRDLDHEGDWQ